MRHLVVTFSPHVETFNEEISLSSHGCVMFSSPLIHEDDVSWIRPPGRILTSYNMRDAHI